MDFLNYMSVDLKDGGIPSVESVRNAARRLEGVWKVISGRETTSGDGVKIIYRVLLDPLGDKCAIQYFHGKQGGPLDNFFASGGVEVGAAFSAVYSEDEPGLPLYPYECMKFSSCVIE